MKQAVIPRASRASTAPLHSVHHPLKVPNVNDIKDLANQLRQMTDVLSQLLSNGVWWKALPPEHRDLLESNIEQFKAFSKQGAKLLQTLFKFSRQVAALLASISDSTPSSVERLKYANEMQPKLQGICDQIFTVEQLYRDLVSKFGNLMRIAHAHQHPRNLDRDDMVFQRLDALLRVVDSELSSALEGGFTSIPAEAIQEARARWVEYADCLSSHVNIPTECSDYLQSSAKGLKAYNRGGTTPLSGLKKALKVFLPKRA